MTFLCEAQFESHPVCSSLPLVYLQTLDIRDLFGPFPRTLILFTIARLIFKNKGKDLRACTYLTSATITDIALPSSVKNCSTGEFLPIPRWKVSREQRLHRQFR